MGPKLDNRWGMSRRLAIVLPHDKKAPQGEPHHLLQTNRDYELVIISSVSYTHLTLPTIYSV